MTLDRVICPMCLACCVVLSVEEASRRIKWDFSIIRAIRRLETDPFYESDYQIVSTTVFYAFRNRKFQDFKQKWKKLFQFLIFYSIFSFKTSKKTRKNIFGHFSSVFYLSRGELQSKFSPKNT